MKLWWLCFSLAMGLLGIAIGAGVESQATTRALDLIRDQAAVIEKQRQGERECTSDLRDAVTLAHDCVQTLETLTVGNVGRAL